MVKLPVFYKMAATKAGPHLSQPIWDTDPVDLKDFLMRNEVPTVARVVKGQFMNIGTSKFNPLKKLHQDVLVHSIKTGLKILAHSVMRVEGRDGRTTRLINLEQRLSIPSTYKGWFELLSEDGRAFRPIETVHQLSKMYPEIGQVLVRQNVKAYLLNNEGKMVFDKTKVVLAGEQLKLVGDVSVPVPPNFQGQVRLLKCEDSRGDTLYLSFDQKGLFTPIAGPTDVLGVFTIKDIIKRFRLPLTIKLIQGVWPKVDSSRFTGIIRLDWAYTDETAFICPLDRSAPRIYPIPTEVQLKLVSATNNNELKENEAFTNIMVKCNRLVGNYHNTIHLIVSVPEGAVKAKSHAFANLYSESKSNSLSQTQSSTTTIKRSRSREDILLDQVDDLYGYLREGKQPPIAKYARDSDEETYYEEPEFEPIDTFKNRLTLLNKGDAVGSQKNARYNFVDPRANLTQSGSQTKTGGPTNGHVIRRIPGTPPDLPPRLYKRVDSAPVIKYIPRPEGNDSGGSGSGRGSGKIVSPQSIPESSMQRRKSREEMSKGSKDSKSSDEQRRRAKDGQSSRSGSSKTRKSRKAMPLLYL